MKNEDNQCFKWCITRALNPVGSHPERITNDLRKQSEEFDWKDIDFPVTINQISKFERRNEKISVSVFFFEKGEIHPLRSPKFEKEKHIDLLLITEEAGPEQEKHHYCIVKNLSRLLSSQTSKNDHKLFYCRRCLNHFPKEEKLQNHKEYCSKKDTMKLVMPKKDSLLYFKNQYRKLRLPIVVYADFESFLVNLDSCEPDLKRSFTEKYQSHKPCGFCYRIIFSEDIKDSIPKYFKKPFLHRAKSEKEDTAQIFVDQLEKNIKKLYKSFPKSVNHIYKISDKNNFMKSEKCWICGNGFEEGEKADKRFVKVRDHCHFIGKYRGAAHNICNKKYKRPNFTPVFFHNLKGYDSHLFVKNLGKNKGEIKCIANNEEKYISFSKYIKVGDYEIKGKEKPIMNELRFLDSAGFMQSSLASLVKNLSSNPDKLVSIKSSFHEKSSFVSRKGIYPYDWMDSFEKFSMEKLPPKEKFFDKLNEVNVSDEDYKHAQNVWNEFGIKNMGEYHDLYLKTDVLLLADVFEELRNVCLENYDLDPAWYYTSPGLAWDAALKKTDVCLELLTDPDMLLMFEKGIRGGISVITKRHGKANNPYMEEDYDKNSPTKYITYLDANNLYGWAMCKPLPVSSFYWMREEELKSWDKIPCILEVDLEYPKEIHEEHNDYPLAPEEINVNGTNKLIPNLCDKEKYVVHHEILKLYLKLGLRIKKIHRGIRFNEKNWLKSYIEMNTELRKKGKNDFEKDFFKLMNNSVFGKTMENIRNRVDIRLINERRIAEKLVSKLNFKHITILDENLVSVHMQRTRLFFNKPIYCGMAILDNSKILMYDFHYNYMKKKFENVQLLFTDTDSLCYEIETEDFFKDISADVDRKFDTSNFDKDHKSGLFSGKNKKVIGMMKDEAGGKIIKEFVGLRAKLYSYKMHSGSETKKCKGIKKSVIKNGITHEDYKKCLFSKKPSFRKMNVIRSHVHNIYTEKINKVALSGDDDKRIIMKNGINTKAIGHSSLY